MFNQSRIIARHESNEFSVTPRDKGNPSKWLNHPKDTRGYYFTFRDGDGIEVATAHRYLCPSGPVTDFDPKTLTINGLRYVLIPDPKVANPEHRLPFIWMRKAYGWVRRHVICPVFGPLAVLPRITVSLFLISSRRALA